MSPEFEDARPKILLTFFASEKKKNEIFCIFKSWKLKSEKDRFEKDLRKNKRT